MPKGSRSAFYQGPDSANQLGEIADLRRSLNPLLSLSGRLIKDVALTPHVANEIEHKLGRALKGYIVVKRNPPNLEFKATMASNQSVPNTTATKLNFDTEAYDLGNHYDVATYQVTIPVNGTYKFDGMAKWQAPLGGLSAQIAVYKNNTTVLSTNVISQNDAGTDPVQETHFEGRLVAGDVVGLWCSQGTGGPINMLAMTTGFFRGSVVDRLYDGQAANTTPTKTLRLYCTVAQTVSLWVF